MAGKFTMNTFNGNLYTMKIPTRINPVYVILLGTNIYNSKYLNENDNSDTLASRVTFSMEV